MKSHLTIKTQGDILVIKKRASIWDILLFCGILGATVAFPFMVKGAWGEIWFWGVYAFILFANVAQAVSLFFGKVVLDKGKKEITIGILRRKTYSFDQISDIYRRFEEGDPEGRDRYEVIVRFNDGSKRFIETNSREQTMELIDTVKSIFGLN